MKNNCDVSGQHGDRAECKGEYESDGCDHWGPRQTSDKCYHYNCGYCHSLTAIRAAIEAEQKEANLKNHACDLNLAIDGTCFVCGSKGDAQVIVNHIVDANKKGGE